MAVYGISLNAMLDGTQQTALIRFTVDDSLIPNFLAYYRKQFTPREGYPPNMTDVAVFKEWARLVIRMMQSDVRRDAEQKTASDAVATMPPPTPPIES